MSIVWGNFESMALHFLRELSNPETPPPVLFSKTKEAAYGVATYAEFADMLELSGVGMYRPVAAMDAEEFLGLFLARFHDILEKMDHELSS